ncbi:MAG: phage portal protein, partial [Anaerolineae bacterium]
MLTFDRKLSPAEDDQVVEQWQNFKGAKNAHSTAVMPGGAIWTPVQSTPKDLLMSEQDETDEKNIVKIWGMHRALLGSVDVADPLSANSTYSGYEINFIRNSVLPRTENVILAALNEQWAWRDFDRSDFYTLAVDEMAIPQLAEAQLAKSETSINLSSAGITDLDEGRQMIGYPARGEGEYLLRNPALPRIALESGAITLAEYRQMVTGHGGDDPNANVILLGGQVIPADRLMEVASANADRLLNPVTIPIPSDGSGFDNPPSTQPGVPQLPEPNPPDAARAGSSICIALDLANDPGLITLQRRVQELCAGQQVKWVPPEKFHVTLLVVPLADDDEQVDALIETLSDIEAPELELRVGSLNCFDNVGEYPLHFRFRRNQALYDFQQEIYDLVAGMGLQISGHHVPGNYTPHVTMGTCKQKPRPVTYRGKITVRAGALVVWKDDDEVYNSA